MISPFFDQGQMAVTPQQYVAWLDVMGTASTLQRSLGQAANFVCKLHSSCLNHLPQAGVVYYPMNDGAYLVGDIDPILRTLRDVMIETAGVFLAERNGLKRYMIRGAVAYGDVVHGSSAVNGLHPHQLSPTMVERVLLGMPTAIAYRGEGQAAPFGIFVDPSARNSPATQFPFFKWWQPARFNARQKDSLLQKIETHIDWCLAHPIQTAYPKDRAEQHRILAREYFE